MATPDGGSPTFYGVKFKELVLTADDSVSVLNAVGKTTKSVDVTGVTNDADDFIVLPSLADVANGHRITVLCNASSNFEIRTPADSDEEINSENCDGTKEYLATDTTIQTFTKVNNTIGWMGEGRTQIGAYATAIIPD